MAGSPQQRHAPVAVFEDSVLAIGGAVPANRPTSWIAPGSSGHFAVPCYVLVSDGAALVVDTGLAAHWDVIRAGLDAVLANCSGRAVIMTRREPDSICNLPAIVERYAPQAVYCGGIISPLDFFERVDATSMTEHIRWIAKTDIAWLQPGATVSIGRLSLEILPTTLRVLPKNHLYESRSRTLFASDTWALLPQAGDGSLKILRTGDDRLSVAAITRYLRHRFDWLAGIDTAPMQEEVAALAARPIDRICSSCGCLIEGRDLVRSVMQNTVRALDELSCAPRASRLQGLDRGRLAAALG